MQRTFKGLVGAATLLVSLAAPQISEAKNGEKTAAVIGGLLLGAAALAASSNDYRYQDQYPPPPPRYIPPAAPFSPARSVTCYPRDRACYNDDGYFLPSWTSRVF